MFERYSFVAVTTADLDRARSFWVDKMGFTVAQEEAGHYFIVDAGGLRLCVNIEDGKIHQVGGTDPVLGLKVKSLDRTLKTLDAFGVRPESGPVNVGKGAYAILRDPDGRPVVVTETD